MSNKYYVNSVSCRQYSLFLYKVTIVVHPRKGVIFTRQTLIFSGFVRCIIKPSCK